MNQTLTPQPASQCSSTRPVLHAREPLSMAAAAAYVRMFVAGGQNRVEGGRGGGSGRESGGEERFLTFSFLFFLQFFLSLPFYLRIQAVRDQRNVGVHKRVLDITATESLYTATRNDERRVNCSRNDSAQGIPPLRSPLHNHPFPLNIPPPLRTCGVTAMQRQSGMLLHCWACNRAW